MTERVNAVELSLATEEGSKPHLRVLAVEVALEVEQVGLKQRMIAVGVKGWASTKIYGAMVHRPIGPLVFPGVHAVGGQTDLIGNLNIGRRKAQQTPALIARDDHPATFERSAKHACCNLNLSPGKGAANCCRADRLRDSIAAFNQRQALDVETFALAKLGEKRHVAASVVPEVKVLADHDGLGRQALHEHVVGPLRGRELRHGPIEMQDDNGVDAGCLEKLQLLVEVGDKLRRRLWSHNRCRMPIKGHDGRCAMLRGSLRANLGDDGLVTQMHPIVGPNGDNGATILKVSLRKISDHLHALDVIGFQRNAAGSDESQRKATPSDVLLRDRSGLLGDNNGRFGEVAVGFVHRQQLTARPEHRPGTLTLKPW